MKVTAREASVRLNVSYVVAAGILSHLEEIGKAKVVEKRFHASGKGKPTRVYEVDQNVSLDFGAEDVVAPAVPVVAAAPTMEDVVESKVEERMAALARLKSATEPVAPVAEETVAETPAPVETVAETPAPVETVAETVPVADDEDDDEDFVEDSYDEDDDDEDDLNAIYGDAEDFSDDDDEDDLNAIYGDAEDSSDDDDDDYDADEAA